MRNHTVLALALSALSTLSLVPAASAQDTRGRSSEVEVMDFLDGDQVTGTIEGPLGDIIRAGRFGRRVSLIRPRAHFQQEMLKSVENL